MNTTFKQKPTSDKRVFSTTYKDIEILIVVQETPEYFVGFYVKSIWYPSLEQAIKSIEKLINAKIDLTTWL